jgi:two-component system sensor histidine kinase BaeS
VSEGRQRAADAPRGERRAEAGAVTGASRERRGAPDRLPLPGGATTRERRLRRALLQAAVATALLGLAGTLLLVGIALLHSGGSIPATAATAVAVAVLVGGVLAAAGAIALAWWLSRAVAHAWTADLDPVVQMTRRMALGDFAQRLPVRGDDELGELAYALNGAAAALDSLERERATFLAGVAHDLRTPLSALQGNLEGMLSGVLAPEPERLAALQDEVGRLIRLVEDIMTLASGRAGALPLRAAETDLGELTRRLAERFEPLASSRGLALRVAVPDVAVRALADRDRLEQAFSNLLANAVTYTPPGGRIDVRLEAVAGGARWTVTDTGPGIPAELVERVREPFVRGDAARGRQAGAGLGLAIAEMWVRAHGGNLMIDGSQGTRVTVWLPVAGGERSGPVAES